MEKRNRSPTEQKSICEHLRVVLPESLPSLCRKRFNETGIENCCYHQPIRLLQEGPSLTAHFREKAYVAKMNQQTSCNKILEQRFVPRNTSVSALLDGLESYLQFWKDYICCTITVAWWEGIGRIFADNNRMGVWLGPSKSWDALYSELLAYRKLAANGQQNDKIFVWYADMQEPEQLELKEMLETIAYFYPVQSNEPEDSAPANTQYSSRAFQCLVSARMFNTANADRLESYLRPADRRQVHNEAKDTSPNTRRRKGGKRQKKNPHRGLGSTLIAVAVSALTLALIITLMVLIFVGQKNSNGNFPSDDASPVQEYDSGSNNIPLFK